MPRFTLGLAAALIGAAAMATSAHADDSSIRISEIYSDGDLAVKNDYVELQFAAAGQQLAGDYLRVYNPTGSTAIDYPPFPAANLRSENQRTVLVGWNTDPRMDFGVSAFIVLPQAGAYCLMRGDGAPIDCVTWGAFTGFVGGAGTPAPALSASSSISRSITRNCPTLLEVADDTDNSSADFVSTPPSPISNSGFPPAALCAVPVPVTKAKCKKKKKKAKRSTATEAKNKKCKKRKK